MREDKQKICSLFLRTLQATRYFYDLVDLRFDPEKEIVTAVFDNGHTKTSNVAMSSGIAMIKDIINQCM